MRIFNLQTKKHLIGWSAVLGLIINFLLFKLGPWLYKPCVGFCLAMPIYPPDFGFPFKFYSSSWPRWFGLLSYDYIRTDSFLKINFVLDGVFWILVSLILLCLIRYFRRSK